MISTPDLYKEINEVLDLIKKDEITEVENYKASLKLQTLNLKLLHNIRTNTVLVMKKFGIETVKPKRNNEESADAPKKETKQQ